MMAMVMMTWGMQLQQLVVMAKMPKTGTALTAVQAATSSSSSCKQEVQLQRGRWITSPPPSL
jgi:hypothetical protein